MKKLGTDRHKTGGRQTKIESRGPEPEGSKGKARGRAWSGFLSLWASQGPRLISQMPLTTRGGRQRGREEGRAFKGPAEARTLMTEQ